MVKPDWGTLQGQFLAESAKKGISPKDWCEAQGLNYASANATIDVMKVRQLNLAVLDKKYTKDLADAKATIDQLRADVTAGAKRLHINAACVSLPRASSSAGLDDAAAPRLTESAEWNYFRLRERIETSKKQIAGLQEYIRIQCLSSTSR
ncbi:lysis protein [Cedecea davisae]|uniref:lysis protein n=1 Tax=Cedecea davisae TaxID=158484 RepID=UPI002223E832|nr:lysis protein [Cedecea davisae]